MIHRLGLLGLAFVLAGPAVAEPIGFKGANLGAEYVRDPRYDCKAIPTPLGDTVCGLLLHERETVAGRPVRSLFRYYHAGRLSAVVIHFDAVHYRTVTDALVGKYGPARASRETVKNYKGVAFENETLTWQKPEGRLVAQRYAGRLDQSSLRMIDDAAVGKVAAGRARRTQAPESDL